MFTSASQAAAQLAATGYLADQATATTVFLAAALERPLLVEGPAGVGKTELAKAVAQCVGAELIRLQCYEGLDESRALYEWNYKKQLLRIQAAPSDQSWEQTHDDIFTDEFLLTRPLLAAILRADPTVLLVDEVDKTDIEVEALLLEVLSDFQVTIPEMGTVHAVRRPFVLLTSNANRELSEALKRRCLYLYLDYPDQDRERDILLRRVPELPADLAAEVARAAALLRGLELKKAPSIAESIDWARTLVVLGRDRLDTETMADDARRGAQALRRSGPRREGTGPGADRGAATRPRRVSLLARHGEFLQALRRAGLPVSVAEDIDAGHALGAVDVLDRAQVRDAYAAALIKRRADRPAFDTLFDIYFPAVVSVDTDARESSAPAEPPPAEPMTAEVLQFREELLDQVPCRRRGRAGAAGSRRGGPVRRRRGRAARRAVLVALRGAQPHVTANAARRVPGCDAGRRRARRTWPSRACGRPSGRG